MASDFASQDEAADLALLALGIRFLVECAMKREAPSLSGHVSLHLYPMGIIAYHKVKVTVPLPKVIAPEVFNTS